MKNFLEIMVMILNYLHILELITYYLKKKVANVLGFNETNWKPWNIIKICQFNKNTNVCYLSSFEELTSEQIEAVQIFGYDEASISNVVTCPFIKIKDKIELKNLGDKFIDLLPNPESDFLIKKTHLIQ